jgi:hypothetical protein
MLTKLALFLTRFFFHKLCTSLNAFTIEGRRECDSAKDWALRDKQNLLVLLVWVLPVTDRYKKLTSILIF